MQAMSLRKIASIALPLILAAAPLEAQQPLPGRRAAAEILAGAPQGAWKAIPADQLLVMTLAGDRRIVIQLNPRFSITHVANIRALAATHWWDGTSIYRVQDNYVAQWGDESGKKPLPASITAKPASDYSIADTGALPVVKMPSPDSYTRFSGFLDGWPVAGDGRSLWLTHCYGMIGVGRDMAPDAGNGAELYAVIGHAPRHLDRNIALVGRVIEGMANLSSLTRGTGEMGFYGRGQAPTAILSVRLASELPEAERPRFQMFDTASKSFADYADAKAHRREAFFNIPADGADICNIPVPVRRAP